MTQEQLPGTFIDVASVLRRMDAMGDTSERLSLSNSLADILLPHLGLMSLRDAELEARFTEIWLERLIEEHLRAHWPFNYRPRLLTVNYRDEQVAASVTGKGKGNKDVTLCIARLSRSILPHGDHIINDPVRDQRGIILCSVPTEEESVFAVDVAQQKRGNSAALTVTKQFYCGRFLFSPPHPEDASLDYFRSIKIVAQAKNFRLLNTRYEELQKGNLLP